jgi:hypothetical protein
MLASARRIGIYLRP